MFDKYLCWLLLCDDVRMQCILILSDVAGIHVSTPVLQSVSLPTNARCPGADWEAAGPATVKTLHLSASLRRRTAEMRNLFWAVLTRCELLVERYIWSLSGPSVQVWSGLVLLWTEDWRVKTAPAQPPCRVLLSSLSVYWRLWLGELLLSPTPGE